MTFRKDIHFKNGNVLRIRTSLRGAKIAFIVLIWRPWRRGNLFLSTSLRGALLNVYCFSICHWRRGNLLNEDINFQMDGLLRREKFRYYSKSVNAPRNDVSGGALISKTETCCSTSLREAFLNVYCFSICHWRRGNPLNEDTNFQMDRLLRRGKLSNCSEFANAPRNDVSGGALISKTETCCWLERHCEEPSLMFIVLVWFHWRRGNLFLSRSLRGAFLNFYCFSMTPMATWQSVLPGIISITEDCFGAENFAIIQSP
jgi:hypothetical protein